MRIHFIAIGGAAMHNLALAVQQKAGYIVTGSDDEIFDPARTHLEQAGLLPKEIGWHPELITPDIDAIILGMHAREDNPELVRARELGLKIYSFPEYLYEQTKDKFRIVVGGSHGKTTTTAMILYVLNRLGIEADYMVGAQIEGRADGSPERYRQVCRVRGRRVSDLTIRPTLKVPVVSP